MAKIQCNFISYTLKRTVDVTVIIPTVTIPESLGPDECQHVYKEKFPVLYLLHGFGNNHAQWGGYTNIELYAEERNIAVVMFSGENKMYINTGQDDFVTFIQKELPEFITNMFPVSTKKEDTFIAGLSMGGFGALYHGLLRPDLYAAIGAFSPGIAIEGVPVNLFDTLKEAKEIPELYITCGEEDFLYKDNLKFVEALKEKGVDHTWLSVPDFTHEWRFWGQSVEEFLDWLPRVDAYKDEKRKV